MKAKKQILAWLLSIMMILTLMPNQFMVVAQAEDVVSYEQVTTTMELGKLNVSGQAKTYSYQLSDYSTEELRTIQYTGYMYKIDVPAGEIYELDIEYNGSKELNETVGSVYYSALDKEGRQLPYAVDFSLNAEYKSNDMIIEDEAYLCLYETDWYGETIDWSEVDITLNKIANISTIKNSAKAITGAGKVTGTISDDHYIYDSENYCSKGFLLKTTLKPRTGYFLNVPDEFAGNVQLYMYKETGLGKEIAFRGHGLVNVPLFNAEKSDTTYYIWVGAHNIESGDIPVTVSDIELISSIETTPITIDAKPVAVPNEETEAWFVAECMDENQNVYHELSSATGKVYSVELPANSLCQVRFEYIGESAQGGSTQHAMLYMVGDDNIGDLGNLFVNNYNGEESVNNIETYKIQNTESVAKKFYFIAGGEFEEGNVLLSVRSMPDVKVSYRTHIQSIGWEADANDVSKWKSDGAMSGTSGKAKRLEGINIVVDSADANKDLDLGIQYTTHCQSYGWLPWSANGEMNGTEGEAKRLEAISIKLTGLDAEYYDVYYRVHAQSYGWLGWAKNGQVAGTAGYAKRLEGIQIVVVKKGEAINEKQDGITSVKTESYIAKEGVSPVVNYGGIPNSSQDIPGGYDINIAYRTHVQSYGWQGWKYNGQMSGTSGESKRLEGISIKLTNQYYDGDIVYTTHVQSYGWQGKLDDQSTWKKNGEMSGTSGEAKRLEAICINLTGDMGKNYDIYYRVHAQSYGWLGWASNGDPAGTAGYGKRLEGIQIVLVPKGEAGPANSYDGITSVRTEGYISK